MNEQAEATRNLRARLKKTLTTIDSVVFPSELDLVLEMRHHPHSDSEDIGILPIPLQHLCELALRLEEEFSVETHRRCVEIFGEEEYDNERIEFDVYRTLKANPHFNQAAKVWELLERRVRRHWKRELFTPEGHEIIFYADKQFHVFKTKYRKKTFAESEAEIKALLIELENETQ